MRGTTLMAISNSEGHLVLATGNKSELAVGYSTIYGDAVGGYAPIKDVPKSLVWTLARWRNEVAEAAGDRPPIPPNSITKPPSAELRPGQLDSDSLPDYEVLDAVIARYVDGDESVEMIISAGFDAELVRRVARLVDTAEWKRRQYPPGPKISIKAFGRDRRLPISNRWREGRRRREIVTDRLWCVLTRQRGHERRTIDGSNPCARGPAKPASRRKWGSHVRIPLRRRAEPPGDDPRPAAGQGRRRTLVDAHRVRLLDRPRLRRGRHSGAARRRFRRQRHLRLRQHRAGDDRRAGAARARRRARRIARPRRRRPAVRLLPDLARSGPRDRRPSS